MATAIAVSIGLSACKDDDAPKSVAGVDSGLPGDKRASELTVVEQDQLCAAVATYTARHLSEDELMQGTCTIVGIIEATILGTGVDGCETARDQCLAGEDEWTETEGTCLEDWSTCDATVAELEVCAEETVRETEALFASLDCADIDRYDDASLTPETGAACEHVQSRCPGFLQPPSEPS